MQTDGHGSDRKPVVIRVNPCLSVSKKECGALTRRRYKGMRFSGRNCFPALRELFLPDYNLGGLDTLCVVRLVKNSSRADPIDLNDLAGLKVACVKIVQGAVFWIAGIHVKVQIGATLEQGCCPGVLSCRFCSCNHFVR